MFGVYNRFAWCCFKSLLLLTAAVSQVQLSVISPRKPKLTRYAFTSLKNCFGALRSSKVTPAKLVVNGLYGAPAGTVRPGAGIGSHWVKLLVRASIRSQKTSTWLLNSFEFIEPTNDCNSCPSSKV